MIITCQFKGGRYSSNRPTSGVTFFRKVVLTKGNGRSLVQVDVVPCDAREVLCTVGQPCLRNFNNKHVNSLVYSCVSQIIQLEQVNKVS